MTDLDKVMRIEEKKIDATIYRFLIENNYTKELLAIRNKSEDPILEHQKISKIIKLIKGEAFDLTSHGITRVIDGQYKDSQKPKLIRKMMDFCESLKNQKSIPCFITSGTLLGLIRESRFLGHDDDFDLAYVSNFSSKEHIVDERESILKFINRLDGFRAEERTGARATVFYESNELKFKFDLFCSYKNNIFFNEFPLKPNSLHHRHILPLKKLYFYGEPIYVPNNPEKLLELNYGPDWQKPDPTFKFNFREHRRHYRFLLKEASNQ